MDYTLRFKTETEANTVLFTTADDVTSSNFPGHAIDVIGLVYKPTGNMVTSDEGSFPEMAAVPGWHVNVRGPEDDNLAKYHIVVNTPVRMWA